MINKRDFIRECVEREASRESVLAACTGGATACAMRARKQYVEIIKKCQKEYCDATAVERLLDAIKAGEVDKETILKVIKNHSKCDL